MTKGKRWTRKDDEFLHEYFDALGDFIGTHDLGRPKGAAARRVRYLKRCGAWEALDRKREAELSYLRCVGVLCGDAA